jgi:hypothetical protein
MITQFKVVVRSIVYRFPIVIGSLRFIGKKAQRLREFKNVTSLLLELHSDTALQLPLLVEQNRRMFNEIESLKNEIRCLKEKIDAGNAA